MKQLLSGCVNRNALRVEDDLEITASEIRSLLSSYYLTADEERTLEDENFLRRPSKMTNVTSSKEGASTETNFCSVQEAVGEACAQQKKRGCIRSQRIEAINTRLTDETIGNQTSLPTSNYISFYRPDKRTPLDLRRKGGFFSINPLSLSHAKVIATMLAGTPMDADILGEFRKLNREPLILTTVKNEYKPGVKSNMLVYKLNLPIPSAQVEGSEVGSMSDASAASNSKRQLIYNGETLEKSQIIGVRSGNDVSFLTGISAGFIQGVDFNDGKGFVGMQVAMKHIEEMDKDKKRHHAVPSDNTPEAADSDKPPLISDPRKDDENDK